MISIEQGMDRLLKLMESEDNRHPDYKQTVAVADEAKMLVSRKSKDHSEVLKRFSLRESERQTEKRTDLTNSPTRAALSPVRSIFQEVWRTDGVNAQAYQGTEESIKSPITEKIEEHFRNFYSGDTLHKYLFDAMLYYSEVDPNAWIVFERYIEADATDPEARVISDIYPIEITSREAIDYRLDNTGKVEYLATMHIFQKPLKEGNGYDEVTEYFLYAPGFTIHIAELNSEVIEERSFNGYDQVEIQDKFWMVGIFENGTTEVPAIRLSAYKSSQHKGIGEVFFADAIPTLYDLIRDNSFFSVQKVSHVRPMEAQYAKKCNHYDPENDAFCEGGYYSGTSKKCIACHGSGMIMLPTNELEKITLEFPEGMTNDEFLSLTNLHHYFERPIDIPQFYREEINYMGSLIMLIVFSQQGVRAEELSRTVKTATQVAVEKDRIYNKLFPFNERISRCWEKAWRVAFQYHGVYEYTVAMTYPFDLKLETLQELTEKLKAARESGMPYSVIWGIQVDALRQIYRDSPKVVAEIKALETFRPFKGKTPEEISMILQNRANSDRDKLLWENWDKVTTRVRIDEPDFSTLSFNEQLEIIDSVLSEVTEEIEYREQGAAEQDLDLLSPAEALTEEPEINI